MVIGQSNRRHAVLFCGLHQVGRSQQAFLQGEGGVGREMNDHWDNCKRFVFMCLFAAQQQVAGRYTLPVPAEARWNKLLA